ncbi:PREDICTED: venom serine protease 34-like [Papilio xuthus]|uniref:Venom serine protease 34-like n=1 Tax=Papilio xuthus TaxID=66420 RepID=I4DLK7_PAPXU|nr:uncharacterized protein LOC106113494 precursor [Papilio xuthus]BAM18797.1 unknown secreted protein [Papilio xuthus]
MIFKTLCFLLAVNYGVMQDRNCDFFQNVEPNQIYSVYSPGYPRNYTPGVQCRWYGVCPNGYHCRLDCPDINLPRSNMCSMDRLLISRTGDPQLSSAEYYCGRGTLSVTSVAQRLSIGLSTSSNSTGGRFACELRAQQ